MGRWYSLWRVLNRQYHGKGYDQQVIEKDRGLDEVTDFALRVAAITISNGLMAQK